MPGYKKSSMFALLKQGVKEARSGAFSASKRVPRPVKADEESGLQVRGRRFDKYVTTTQVGKRRQQYRD